MAWRYTSYLEMKEAQLANSKSNRGWRKEILSVQVNSLALLQRVGKTVKQVQIKNCCKWVLWLEKRIFTE